MLLLEQIEADGNKCPICGAPRSSLGPFTCQQWLLSTVTASDPKPTAPAPMDPPAAKDTAVTFTTTTRPKRKKEGKP